MQNYAAIRSAFLEKMIFEVVIFGNFLDIPELKLWVREAGCDVSMYVLQSYHFVLFVSLKPEVRHSFG